MKIVARTEKPIEVKYNFYDHSNKPLHIVMATLASLMLFPLIRWYVFLLIGIICFILLSEIMTNIFYDTEYNFTASIKPITDLVFAQPEWQALLAKSIKIESLNEHYLPPHVYFKARKVVRNEVKTHLAELAEEQKKLRLEEKQKAQAEKQQKHQWINSLKHQSASENMF